MQLIETCTWRRVPQKGRDRQRPVWEGDVPQALTCARRTWRSNRNTAWDDKTHKTSTQCLQAHSRDVVGDTWQKKMLRSGRQKIKGPVLLLVFSREFTMWRKRWCSTLERSLWGLQTPSLAAWKRLHWGHRGQAPPIPGRGTALQTFTRRSPWCSFSPLRASVKKAAQWKDSPSDLKAQHPTLARVLCWRRWAKVGPFSKIESSYTSGILGNKDSSGEKRFGFWFLMSAAVQSVSGPQAESPQLSLKEMRKRKLRGVQQIRTTVIPAGMFLASDAWLTGQESELKGGFSCCWQLRWVGGVGLSLSVHPSRSPQLCLILSSP